MITPLNNDTERSFLVRPLTSLAQNRGDVPILVKACTFESVRMNGGICGNRDPLVTTLFKWVLIGSIQQAVTE
mgnify:CR=1 FL=1